MLKEVGEEPSDERVREFVENTLSSGVRTAHDICQLCLLSTCLHGGENDSRTTVEPLIWNICIKGTPALVPIGKMLI